MMTEHERTTLKQRWGDKGEADIVEFVKVFHSLDVERKDGKLDLSEFSKCLGVLGNKSKELASCIFNAVDADGDKFVSCFEFVWWMMVLRDGKFDERVRFGFLMVDKDRSDWISEDEMRNVLKAMFHALIDVHLPDPKMKIDEFVTNFWKTLDVNHLGKVDFDAYLRAAKESPNFFRNIYAVDQALVLPESQRLKLGKSVMFGSAQFNFTVAVMLGIEMGVRNLDRWRAGYQVTDADFAQKETYPKAAATAESGMEPWSFVDYAPKVFREIRYKMGTDDDAYMMSLGIEQMLGNLLLGHLGSLSSLVSEGKSGSFFYFTWDGKYMVKTIGSDEKRQLEFMLKEYYNHLARSPHSLLARFLGLHKLSFGRTVYRFIVMANVFDTPKQIVQRYDLKGSAKGRTVGDSKRDTPGVVLKDLDFLQTRNKWAIGNFARTPMIIQLSRDVELLKRVHVIDYSLLVGITKLTEEEKAIVPVELRTLSRHRIGKVAAQFENGDLPIDPQEEAFFSIIDYLIPYSLRKSAEGNLKKITVNTDGEISALHLSSPTVASGASVCPPPEYGDRFTAFMKEIFQ